MDASAEQRFSGRFSRELHLLYRDSAALGPLGTASGAAVWVLIAVGSTATGRLLTWFVAMLGAAGLMTAALTVPSLRGAYDRVGIPGLSSVGYLLSGVLWGLPIWLDTEGAIGGLLAWKLAAVQLAITSSTMSAPNASTRLRLLRLAPMWAVGGAAALYIGEYAMVAGIFLFMMIAAPDLTRLPKALQSKVRMQLEWERTAERDPLTDLLNRAGVQRRIDGRDHSKAVSALFIDLDHFKDVNDRLGHLAGDELLVQVAQRLTASVRSSDTVGRIGGDEFLILVDQTPHPDQLAALAQRIIDEMERPFELGPDQALISASVGTTIDASVDLSADQLFSQVDHALYAAKRAGRRQVVAFDDDLRADLESRAGMGDALRRAVLADELEVWGQPIVDLETRATVWIELLARWRQGDGNYIPPAVFVPLAEENGLITDITAQVLRRLAAFRDRLVDHPHLADVRLSVNVSPLDLVAGKLTDLVAAVVEEHQLQPGKLVLEVTESRVLDKIDRARSVLYDVRSLGVDVAIDDFGSGYSSLNQLLALPVSIVKLDRSLVASLGHSPRHLALVRSIGDLGRTVGHELVAEGVETETQADMLRRMSYACAQGYLFSPPKPLDELLATGAAPAAPAQGELSVLGDSLGRTALI